MPAYDVSDILGKTLIAATDVPVYTNKPVKYDLKPVGLIKKSGIVGVVDSWVTDSDGTILWQFRSQDPAVANSLGNYYVQNLPGSFSLSSIKAQGVLTLDEKAALQAAKNMSFGDKALGILKIAVFVFAGVLIINNIVKTKAMKK